MTGGLYVCLEAPHANFISVYSDYYGDVVNCKLFDSATIFSNAAGFTALKPFAFS